MPHEDYNLPSESWLPYKKLSQVGQAVPCFPAVIPNNSGVRLHNHPCSPFFTASLTPTFALCIKRRCQAPVCRRWQTPIATLRIAGFCARAGATVHALLSRHFASIRASRLNHSCFLADHRLTLRSSGTRRKRRVHELSR
jgi:hypothetical protein